MPPFRTSTDTYNRVHQQRKKEANLMKAIRLANATKGHEKEVHAARAKVLAKRYGMKITIDKKHA